MRWRTAHRRAARQRHKAALVASLASRIYKTLVDGQRRRGGRLSREDAYDDIMALLEPPRLHVDRFTVNHADRSFAFFISTASGKDASWFRERFERLREEMENPPVFTVHLPPTFFPPDDEDAIFFNTQRYRKD